MEDEPLNPFSIETNGSFALSLSLENDEDFGLDVKRDEISEAFNLAKMDLKHKERLDRENPMIRPNSPSYRHQQTLKGENGSYVYTEKGYLMNRAMEHLIRNHPEKRQTISEITTHNWLNLEFCTKERANCEFPYRMINGYCNNKKHPMLWGVAMRPFARDLSADYCDGIGSPRCAKDKTSLPSSRLISLKLHRPEYKSDPKFTYMFAVWGQFIDHDMTSTALNKGVDGQFLSCCGGVNHPECYPVNISSDDPYYSKFGIKCMEFVRSAPAPTCKFGRRQQLNQVTSYLDGSVVYGSNQELANELRDFSGGKLRMFYTKDGRELLPISTDLNDGCNREEEAKKGKYCFLAGDSRANENLHLTSIHLIMARQHNRLASNLSILNPKWQDEKIYQESRRIVIAQMQHITYNEFLKPLLGEETMEKYRLNPEDYEYNEDIDALMNNNFAAAAFRFAHTLLPKLMKIAANNATSPELVLLHKMLFNPFRLYDAGSLDSVITSAMNTRTDKLDRFFNTETTQHLFQDLKNVTNKTCGLDLVTLNLQRGRDHGLPGYTEWRKFCNLSQIKSFADLQHIMDKDSVHVLKKYYKDIEDIDLYSGALSENPEENAILGPTATCLIAKQFHKIKFGDRYWYEVEEKPQGFTKEQLREIKKTTLAKIICDNSDSIEVIQKYVMEIMEDSNDQINCDSLEEVNLQLWSDSHSQGQLQSLEKRNGTKPSVIKLYASTTLVQGEIFGGYDNGDFVKLFDGTLPAEVYVDNFTDPNGYDVSAIIEWKGVAVNNSLSGSYSLPVMRNSVVKYWKGNFTALVKYKWGGSLDIIEPYKIYKCKLMFNDFNKKARMTLKGKTVKDPESCTIMLAGSFYKKPFYCALTPWWCSDEKIFYWSGDAELIIRKLAANVTVPEKLNYKAVPLVKLDGNEDYIAKNIAKNNKSEKIITVSTFIGGEITASLDIRNSINIYNCTFPMSINTEDFISSDEHCMKTRLEFKGSTISNNTLAGSFSLSVFNRIWTGNFTALVTSEKGGSMCTIEPEKLYKYIIIFDPSKQLSSVEEKTNSESCTIMLSGKFNGRMFDWNGNLEIKLKIYMPENFQTNSELNGNEKMFKRILNEEPPKPVFNKIKTTIVGGEILGFGDDGKAIQIFDGKFPAAVNFDNITDPFSFDNSPRISCEGIFSNNSISGTFIWPITKEEKTKYWRGNFTLNVYYLQSPLFVIEPHKNYTCKLVFNMIQQPSLKEEGNSEEDTCIIIVGLWIYKQPFYCYLMPWSCNNNKAYYWNGDVEVILKSRGLNYYPQNDYSQFMNDHKNDSYHNTFINIHRHTVEGKVRNGYVKVYRPNKLEVWNGGLPVDIQLPVFWQPDPDVNNLHDNYTHGVLFSCSFFQSSIQGSFKLPQYTKFGLIEWAIGTFSFQVAPLKGGTLYDMLMPNVEYYSSIHFHDIDKKMPILHLENGKTFGGRQNLNMTILILGKHNFGPSKTFTWNGKFYIIIDNIPYMQRLI